MGRLDEAHIELEKVLAKDPKNEEANKMYVSVEPLQRSIAEVNDFMATKNYQPAVDRLTELVEVWPDTSDATLAKPASLFFLQHIPWDSQLRELRADAYLGLGNTIHAISEMRALTKLTNDNTEGFFKLATLYYQVAKATD